MADLTARATLTVDGTRSDPRRGADPAPAAMARLGLIRTFQELKLVRRLSVFDNVRIGAGRGRRPSLLGALVGLPAARRQGAAIRQATQWAIDFVGLGAH